MVVRRIIAFLLGAFMIFCGAYCIRMPQATYISLAWITGFTIILDSVMQLYTWDHLKNLNFWNKWEIVGAVISLIFGIALICSFGLREAFSEVMLYVFAVWMILNGIFRLVASVKLREWHIEFRTELLGKKWWVVMLAGLLLIAMGILICFFPVSAMKVAGVLVGVGVIITGLSVSTYAILF